MEKRKLADNENEEIESKSKFQKTLSQNIALDLAFSQEMRLGEEFFSQNCLDLSKNLLGKYLIRKLDNTTPCIACKIVEVEAYLGGTVDTAAHSYNFKKTPKNEAMYMKCGTAYVYNIYGIYCCLNIIANDKNGSGVLIRALEPTSLGIESLKANRKLDKKANLKLLTNGPSKLCQAMMIKKDLFNKVDLTKCESLWLQHNVENQSGSDKDSFKIMSAKRIGIDYADQVAINSMFRFYIKDNAFVSVKAKDAVQIN